MARIPSEDSTDSSESDETTAADEPDYSRPAPTDRMEDIGTAPEPDEPDPSPEPDQPARGNDPDSGDGRASGGTGDVNETEPMPEPEPNQPARGGDPDSGDGRGSGGADTPEEPDSDPDSPDPEPEPEQPARGGGQEPTEEPDEPTEPDEPEETSPTGEEGPPPETPEPEEGIEDDPRTQTIGEQATELEQQVLSENPELDSEDVRVVEEDGTLKTELTVTGQEAFTAADLGLEESDIAITPEGNVVGTTETGEAQLTIEGITEGIEQEYPEAESFSIQQEEPGVFDVEVETPEGTEQFVTGSEAAEFVEEQRERARQEARTQLEQRLEEQATEAELEAMDVERGRAEALTQAGVTADLEPGEDFTIGVSEEGASAELTEGYKQELRETAAASELEDFYATELQADDVTVDEDAGIELTESGKEQVAETGTVPVEQERVGGAVQGIRETFGLKPEGDGEELVNRVPAEKVLGEYETEAEGLAERPAMAARRRGAADLDPIDTSGETPTISGDIRIELPDEPRPAQGAMGEIRRDARGAEELTRPAPEADTLAEFLSESQEEVAQYIGNLELGRDEAPKDLGPGPRGQMTVEPMDRDSNVREFTASAIKAPAQFGGSLPFIAPSLALGVSEVTTKAGVATAEGELGEFAGAAGTAAAATGVRGAETALEDPAGVGGAVTGSLVATGAVMGGARQVSQTANLATRAAIQPGEELLGRTGAALVPGRAGRVLFPRGEPLFASEEAAIFALRKTKRTIEGGPSLPRVELRGTARQQDILERFTPEIGGGRELTLTESGDLEAETVAPGAQSEPLGSPTEDIVTASMRGGGGFEFGKVETETTTETEAETQGITEQMREMAGEATAREQLQQAADEIGVEIEDFVSDERGQASLISQRRGATESEVRRTEDRVTANLYQQSITRQVQTEYETLQETIETPETRLADRGPTGRLRRAAESEVETEAETELSTEIRVEPFAGLAADQSAAVDVRPGLGTDTALELRPELATDTDLTIRPDVRQEAFAEQETRLETELETEQELELEQELEQEFEIETELETETETEAEVELPPFEAETEQETEADLRLPRDERMDDTPSAAMQDVSTDVFKNIDRDLQDLAEEF